MYFRITTHIMIAYTVLISIGSTSRISILKSGKNVKRNGNQVKGGKSLNLLNNLPTIAQVINRTTA